MTADQYSLNDYIRVDAPLQLILGLVMIFVIPVLFPF